MMDLNCNILATSEMKIGDDIIKEQEEYSYSNNIKWEVVKEYEEVIDDSFIPTRGTKGSCGYDLKAAKDTVIPSIFNIIKSITHCENDIYSNVGLPPYTLSEIDNILKTYKGRATIVPTGLKCSFPINYKCGIYSRSSMPYKHLLMIVNGPGTIDADYYNNPDNEGHIGVMFINLSPFDILIKKGDKIAQAIFTPYSRSWHESGIDIIREGGYGSTGKR